ncbi:hypothetical protein Taro_053477, partial [Colocasia esculenta]|nr:hypothetical protein [Colocasia esculenta]
EIPDYMSKLIPIDQMDSQPLKGIRVGVICETLGEGVDAGVLSSIQSAAVHLEDLGAVVTEVSLPSFSLGLPAYYILASSESSSNLSRYDGIRYGNQVPEDELISLYGNSRANGFGSELGHVSWRMSPESNMPIVAFMVSGLRGRHVAGPTVRSRVGTQSSVCGCDKVLVAIQNATQPPSPSGLVATPGLSHSGCDMGCLAFRPYLMVRLHNSTFRGGQRRQGRSRRHALLPYTSWFFTLGVFP